VSLIGPALLVLALASCSGPQPAPPPDASAITAAAADGVPCGPGEEAYAGSGVRTYPAPAGTPVTLTAAAALAYPGVPIAGPGAARSAELRLVTTGFPDCGAAPTGVVRLPGWVVTVVGTAPVLSHPAGGQDVDPATLTCTSVVIGDAQSGEGLSGTQACKAIA
jgi:hypothetical protein